MASKIYNIDSKTFESYVKNSSTFTEILRKCLLENKGSNINTVIRRIKKENLDASHIKRGLGHNKGTVCWNTRISLEDAYKKVFIKMSSTKRGTVKILIERYKLKEYKCVMCGIGDMWNNKPISLQLDHINGSNNDNRLENLRYLCPNCHSQTATFCGRSSKNK
jgi:Zn finger protein HypA/HybF involved in hydrogenase expression